MLLDTCAFLWLVGDQTRLSALARTLIAANAQSLYVSAITAFEIGVKQREGGPILPKPPEDWVRDALRLHGLSELAIDIGTAVQSTQLPALHSDPCDRIIVATGIAHDLTILTPDALIAQYPGVRVSW